MDNENRCNINESSAIKKSAESNIEKFIKIVKRKPRNKAELEKFIYILKEKR